jgi:hypothetical protein
LATVRIYSGSTKKKLLARKLSTEATMPAPIPAVVTVKSTAGK